MPKRELKKPSSAALRETKKLEVAKQQINANIGLDAVPNSLRGKNTLLTYLHPVSTYSTKFMDMPDQITLAVDKIEIPEIKISLIPVDPAPEHYFSQNVETYDYTAYMSMNDGDPKAFRQIVLNMDGVSMREFRFAVDECEEENSWRKDCFVLMYEEKSETQRAYTFDFYNPNGFAPSPNDVPTMSASIMLTDRFAGIEDSKPKWEYAVSIHLAEPKRPKDVILKAEYAKMQELIRSALVFLGVIPSKVMSL